jgi:cytochrome c-type biogenesis protein CcmE
VLAGTQERLPVEFSGTVPPLFAEGRRVVVEGQMGAGGVFHADVLLTQCASKYDGNPHDQGNAR